MDISWKQAVSGMFCMAMVVAVIRPSAFDESVPEVTPTPAPKGKQTVKGKAVRQVEVRHLPAGKAPDGYISRNECFEIPEDMKISDVVYRFGWPAGSNGRAMGLGEAEYPIREDHGATCKVFFPYGTVSAVIYRKDSNDYEGTETWPGTS